MVNQDGDMILATQYKQVLENEKYITEKTLKLDNTQNIDVSSLPSGIYFIYSKDANLPTLQFLKR